MKLSVSMTEEDVAVLDRYVREAGLPSRSAAVQVAVRRLGHSALEDAYAQAWDEWETAGGADGWDAVAGDGLGDAAG